MTGLKAEGALQARQHRRFGDGDVLQRLAEQGLARPRSHRPVAQEDLVHVDLEDLVLGQQVLQLEREQTSYSLRVKVFSDDR